MAFDESLAACIRDTLARRKGVEEKQMFGGVGFLRSGNMLVGVWKDSLIARLGPDEGELALLEPHVKEFDITGRSMKGWGLAGHEPVPAIYGPSGDVKGDEADPTYSPEAARRGG